MESNKLLELMNKLKLKDTRSIYKNRLYFYALNSEQPEYEIKKKILFVVVSKGIKYFGINWTKEV